MHILFPENGAARPFPCISTITGSSSHLHSAIIYPQLLKHSAAANNNGLCDRYNGLGYVVLHLSDPPGINILITFSKIVPIKSP